MEYAQLLALTAGNIVPYMEKEESSDSNNDKESCTQEFGKVLCKEFDYNQL